MKECPCHRRSKTIQIIRKSIELFKNKEFKELAEYLLGEEHNDIKPKSAAVSIFINKLYLTQNEELKKAAEWIVFSEVYVTWPHFERHYDASKLAEQKVFYCNELKEHYKESLAGMELEFREEFDALDADAKATQESREYFADLLNDSYMKADD